MTQSNEKPKGIVISNHDQEKYRKLPLNEQYAVLMALGDPEDYDVRYTVALEDFKKLVMIDGVTTIGINWEHAALLVGTENVEVEDDPTIRLIGDLVFTITQLPPKYVVSNVSQPLYIGQTDGKSKYAAHPHALQHSQFCMSASNIIVHAAITDGLCSSAIRILVAAARMRKSETNRGMAFGQATLDKWPRKEVK